MGNCLSGEPAVQQGQTQSPKPAPVSKKQPAQSHIDVAIDRAKHELHANKGQDFYAKYDANKIIGHGAFAKVMICTLKSGGSDKFAVKCVEKNHDEPEKQREGIIKEIAIMRMLQDHPNCVHLIEVFENSDSYQLVLELCSGGELFDQIIAKGHFSEKDAANHMRALLDFLAYAHSKDVIHRDLKPENILLSSKSSSAVLKVIDFGTSDFCREGQRLSQKFGTPYYVAPEVLKKDYDKQADIWSTGVIMYILLCGFPPFGGKTDSRILQRVAAGAYSFDGKEWEVVTEAAKDMIRHMLVLDISQRSRAADLLNHRWFQMASTAPAAALGQHMVKRLREFAGMSRMKRLALVVLARTLTDTDVKRLRELFVAMDTDNDGLIDAGDLHKALDKVGAAIDDQEMQQLFAASDVQGTGKIDYEGFIAAMLDSGRVGRRKEAVRASFEEMDKDHDGFITAEDLLQVMPRGSSIELARQVLSEVDKENTGRVDYEKFQRMMQE